MAHSIITYTGDGVLVQFAIDFTLGILSRDHVTCQVNNEVDGNNDPVFRTLTFITDGLVDIGGTVPADGDEIEFLRTVPKTILQHRYMDGVAINDEHLDDSNLQLIMISHELLDGRSTFLTNVDIDMNGFKITNLADGVLDTDAATVGQIGNSGASATAAAASAAAALISEVAAAASAAAAAADAAVAAAVANPTANRMALFGLMNRI